MWLDLSNISLHQTHLTELILEQGSGSIPRAPDSGCLQLRVCGSSEVPAATDGAKPQS